MSLASNLDDALRQLQEIGLQVSAADLVIGQNRRVRVRDMGTERRGWYRLHEVPRNDGIGSLIVGSFGYCQGAEIFVHKLTLPRADLANVSADQKAAWRAAHAKARADADAEAKRSAEAAAKAARDRWASSSPAVSSPYLERKGIQPHGARIDDDGTLLVPIQDITQRIRGLQLIFPERRKVGELETDKLTWPKGAAIKGHFFQIGGIPRDLLLIAEGFATSATLHQATGLTVYCAFFAGNLLPVAKLLAKAYPAAKILLCADDDYLPTRDGKPNHGGEIAARAAAAAVLGSVVLPVFEEERPVDRKGPTDFNDLAHIEGLHVVRRQIEAHLSSLGWLTSPSSRATLAPPGDGGGDKRPAAKAVLDLDTLVCRFIPIDDGMGDSVFDTWTKRLASKKQMVALLPAGVRADDIKRHPDWIERGAYYVDEIGFDPAGTDPSVKLNTWQGWPIKPKRGNCERLIELIDYLCSNDECPHALSHWLQCWMAYPLQNPGAKMSSAVIMHGPQGTGKSTVFQTLAEIYGDYATVLNQRGLEDKFNADWTDSKLFILAEEVVNRQEMWAIKGELKELVTGTTIRIRDLHRTAYRQRNHVNMVFLSNEDQPLPLDNDDRRHLVVYTPPEHPEAYYDRLFAELAEGGAEAFYYHLLHLDLEGFHPKKRPPMTTAKGHLLQLSLPSERRFLQDWISGDLDYPVVPCLSTDLYACYLRWCRNNGESRPRTSSQFYACVHHMHGWQKTKTRVYETLTATETVPKPIVIPPKEAVVANGTVPPPGITDARWFTDCIARFATAMDKGSDR